MARGTGYHKEKGKTDLMFNHMNAEIIQPELLHEKIRFGGVMVDKANALHVLNNFYGEGTKLPPIKVVNDPDLAMAYSIDDGFLISDSLPQQMAVRYLRFFQAKTGYTLPLDKQLIGTIKSNETSRNPSARANLNIGKTKNLKLAVQVVKQPLFGKYFETIKEKLSTMDEKEKEIFIKRRLKGYMRVSELAIQSFISAAFIHEYFHYLTSPYNTVSIAGGMSAALGFAIPIAAIAFHSDIYSLASAVNPDLLRGLDVALFAPVLVAMPGIGIAILTILQDRLHYKHEVGAYLKQAEFIQLHKPPFVDISSRNALWAPCFSSPSFVASLQLQ